MNELRATIQDALLELLAPPPRRALVLFTGGLLGFEDAIVELRRLSAEGVRLDYLQTPSAQRILDQQLIGSLGMREVSQRMVAEHDLLLAPTLTANLAAKVAHGVADCLASNLFAEFIMSNRLVVASRTAVCPDGAAKRSWFPEMPAGYADLLRANLAAMAGFGVRLSESRFLSRVCLAAWERRDQQRRASLTAALGNSYAGLKHAFGQQASPLGPEPVLGPTPPGNRNQAVTGLISQQVIQQLPSGTILRLGPKALVTAAARDAAASRSIQILKEV